MSAIRNFLGFAALLATRTAFAQCEDYSVQIVQSPICGSIPSDLFPRAITESGKICGYWQNCSLNERPFYWDGTLHFLQPPQSTPHGRALDMNDFNVVVGTMTSNGSPPNQPFVYANNSLVALPLLEGANLGYANAVTNSASPTIVGYCQHTFSGRLPLTAVRWDSNVISQLSIGLPPYSVANDISDAGLVAGWAGQLFEYVFRWQDGKITLLPLPPGGTTAEAKAVNNSGDACGYFTILKPDGRGFTSRAIVWNADGSIIDLGTHPGGDFSRAHDINDYGDVVGNSNSSPVVWPGFLWRKSTGTMVSLQELVPPDIQLTTINTAYGINNAGQIVAQARTAPPGAAWVALILTPNPPPPGDFNCDKTVNVDDLLGVINSWGIVGGGPADFNGDKTVNAADLMIVIEQWSF